MKRVVLILLSALMVFGIVGCGEQDGISVPVQTVAEITGMGPLGINNRFSGIVVASVEEKIYKDENGTIASCEVKAGDRVEAGELLFTYDMEAKELALEKARLEVARIENTIAGLEDQLEKLKREKENAPDSQKLSYTLEIQSTQTTIREENYNLSVKKKALEQLEASIGEEKIYSPISGRVQVVNDEGGYDENGSKKPYITILDTSSFRVEGTVNEMNIRSLSVGTPVILRSRVDDQTWEGYVDYIDFDNPVQDENRYYGDPEGGSNSSTKYHFYVVLESNDGLMLGQHLYIEENEQEGGGTVQLPEYYLCEVNGDTAWVWAASSKDTLEKRSVKLGDYHEDTCMYDILEGLSLTDSVAFPDENWKAGMKVIRELPQDVTDDNSNMPGGVESTATMAGGVG